LHRVYESLKSQTFRDFEWLIADDGSTDNSKELIQKWIKEANFPIRYIFWEKNVGQTCTISRGFPEAHGEFFLILDSDDACVPEALECFKKYWDLIPEESKNEFTGVSGLCLDQNGKLVGNKFPQDLTDSNSLEIRFKYKVKGEKWGFHRTDVLKQFPFPDIQDSGNIPKGIVWTKIALRFKTRYINQPLRIYYVEYGNRSDQITRPSQPGKNALGQVLYHRLILNEAIIWFRYAPAQFLRSAILYVRNSAHVGIGLVEQVKKLDNWLARVLWSIMLPFGLLLYQIERTSFYPVVQKLAFWGKK